MKKLLILISLSILLISFANAEVTIISQKNQSTGFTTFSDGAGTLNRGNTFRVGVDTLLNTTYLVNKVGFNLSTAGVGNLFVSIQYTNASRLPNGTEIANVTIPAGAITNNAYVNFTLNSTGILLPGETYAIVSRPQSTLAVDVTHTVSNMLPVGARIRNNGVSATGWFNDTAGGELSFELFGLQDNLTVQLVSPANNLLTADTNITFNATIFGSNLTNATIFIWNSTGVYNFSVQNLSGINSFVTFSYLLQNIDPGIYQWNVYACVVTECESAPSNFTFTTGLVENSQTFNSNVISGTTQTFLINVTSSFPGISAFLHYNNTNYSSTVTTVGNEFIFNATITVPTVTAITQKNFFWILVVTDGGGNTFQINSTTQTQTINPLQVDNCSTFTSPLLNFTLFDEDDRTQLNGTIEVDVTFYSGETIAGTFNNTFNFVANGNPSRICVNSSVINSSLTLDYHVRYYSNVSLYVVEHKFAQRLNVTNQSRQVNLYDLLFSRSTSFQIILQSATLNTISGAVVDIQREYVPINQLISVESPLTDVYGMTVGHFVAEEVYYNFIVTKNGVLLGTFNRQLAKCQNVVTGDCRITLNLIQATAGPPHFQTYGNISVNYLWSPSTRTLFTTWLSADSNTHTVSQNVTILDNFGNSTVCSNSANALSGTFTCTVPSSYGNTSIISYLYSDGAFLGFSIFNLGGSSEDIFGGTKIVLGILMYCTLVFLMIAHPITLVMGAILGMAFLIGFHIADGGSFIGNSSIFLWFIIAGGIIIYQISRNR